MGHYARSVQIGRPAAEVWELLADPTHVTRCSPPEASVEILQAPPEISLGSRVRFRVRVMGQSRTSEHEIVVFDPPYRFVEEQVSGPLKAWRHEHRIEPRGENACELIEDVDFKPPGGLVGLMINESMIKKHLDKAFTYRQEAIRRLLESAADSGSAAEG